MKKCLFMFFTLVFALNNTCFASIEGIIEPKIKPIKPMNGIMYDVILGICLVLAIILSVIFINQFIKGKKQIEKSDCLCEERVNLLKKNKINFILKLIITFIILGIIISFFDILTTPIAKPIIYLYPEKTQKISIILGKPENLTCTYPKYNDGWTVLAEPNGNLKDLTTGRSLYALYWEGKKSVQHNLEEGFVVKGEETITFLEEKLALLGLTEREANEFIIYWLPKLEANKYNFIRFQTQEEVEKNMPLKISPKPDTIIRVVMEYKALNKPIEVKEQNILTPERNGFVAVEWGGTEIKSFNLN